MSLAHVHVIIVLFFWCWASHPRLSYRFGCLPPISAVTTVWGERYVWGLVLPMVLLYVMQRGQQVQICTEPMTCL